MSDKRAPRRTLGTAAGRIEMLKSSAGLASPKKKTVSKLAASLVASGALQAPAPPLEAPEPKRLRTRRRRNG